jgi:hypothetical protein
MKAAGRIHKTSYCALSECCDPFQRAADLPELDIFERNWGRSASGFSGKMRSKGSYFEDFTDFPVAGLCLGCHSYAEIEVSKHRQN